MSMSHGPQGRALVVVVVAAVGCALACFASVASAQLAPARYGYGSMFETDIPGSESFDVQTINTSRIYTSSTTGGRQPMADQQSSLDDYRSTPILGTDITAYVGYEFMISGPANSAVPVNASGSGDAQVSGVGSMLAIAAVRYAGFAHQATAGSDGPAHDSFTFNEMLLLEANVPYSASVVARVSLRRQGIPNAVGHSEGQAVADPLFTIDPTYLDASLYTIEYSPGLLPEPGAVVPLLGAMAAFPFRRRRAWTRTCPEGEKMTGTGGSLRIAVSAA